jgi:hypothetical protein
MKYKAFFEIYGKRLKTIVDANSADEAKNIVIKKIIFHKIVLMDDDNDIDSSENFKPSDNFDVEDIKNKLGIK